MIVPELPMALDLSGAHSAVGAKASVAVPRTAHSGGSTPTPEGGDQLHAGTRPIVQTVGIRKSRPRGYRRHTRARARLVVPMWFRMRNGHQLSLAPVGISHFSSS